MDNSLPMTLDIVTQDDKIMQGLWYEENGDINNSIKVFNGLYNETKSDAYLLEEIRISLIGGIKLKESELALNKLRAKNPLDAKVLRLLMTLHLVQKKFDKANTEAEEIIKFSKDPEDIGVASDALIYANNPNRALDVLGSLYDETQNEDIALRMAVILNDMYNEKQQAISLLEKHYAKHGGSAELQDKLFDILLSSSDLDGAYSFASDVYRDSKDYSYIAKVAEEFYMKKECEKANNIIKLIVSKDEASDEDISELSKKIDICLKATKENK